MTPYQDISGRRFGKLVALRLFEVRRYSPRSRQEVWMCQCDCGKISRTTTLHRLLHDKTHSCGCLIGEAARKKGIHRMSHTKLYRKWHSMKRRCLNPKDRGYENYGGRGITVCERWMYFENFVLDMGDPPTPGHSIGRKNNDGNYEPENCQWETRLEQNRNSRHNVLITAFGKTQCISEWAKELGVSAQLMYKRKYNGWGGSKLLAPSNSTHKKLTPEIVRVVRGSVETPPALARRFNVSRATIHRVLNGESWVKVQ